MLLNLSELGLILSFCEDWNITSREYNVSLMILLWYREYKLSLMILYHPLSSCEPWQLKHLNNWQKYWWWKSLQILKKNQFEALTQILNLHGVYTHTTIF